MIKEEGKRERGREGEGKGDRGGREREEEGESLWRRGKSPLLDKQEASQDEDDE